MLEKVLKKPLFFADFGAYKRFKIDTKSHPIFNVVLEAILAGFRLPLGLNFGSWANLGGAKIAISFGCRF